jgi:hypothetical protein
MGETQHNSPMLPSKTQTQYFSVDSSFPNKTACLCPNLTHAWHKHSPNFNEGNTPQFPKVAKLHSDSIFFCGPQFNWGKHSTSSHSTWHKHSPNFNGGNTAQYPKGAKLHSDSIFFCGVQFNGGNNAQVPIKP